AHTRGLGRPIRATPSEHARSSEQGMGRGVRPSTNSTSSRNLVLGADPQPAGLQGTNVEGAMRSTKTNATAAPVKAEPTSSTTPDLAAVGLLEDDAMEETSIRRAARPNEPAEETPEEFVDIEFHTSIDRVAVEPARPLEPALERQLKD